METYTPTIYEYVEETSTTFKRLKTSPLRSLFDVVGPLL